MGRVRTEEYSTHGGRRVLSVTPLDQEGKRRSEGAERAQFALRSHSIWLSLRVHFFPPSVRGNAERDARAGLRMTRFVGPK
jgi:hypothetical protein